jgi:hypothetical protein
MHRSTQIQDGHHPLLTLLAPLDLDDFSAALPL